MFTYERAKEVESVVETYGIDKASERLKMSTESIHRYLRQLKFWNKNKSETKILLFDIETAPSRAFVWNMWKENTTRDKLISDGYIISYAAKWLNSNKTMIDALPFYDDYHSNMEYDYNVVKSLYKLMNDADIVIAHNGNRFDMKVLRTRLIFHGFKPFSPTKQIDTLLIAKSLFKFPSNRLDSIGDYLGLGRKIEHEGFRLWRRCMDGEMSAWDKMIEYNEGDVELLEKVYLKLRAWDKRHPNVSVNNREMKCNVCGSDVVEKGEVSTNISVYISYQCKNCGHWHRSRYNIKDKEQMKNTLTNG